MCICKKIAMKKIDCCILWKKAYEDSVMCCLKAKKVVIYLARAKPDRLVEEMMIELQVKFIVNK